MTKEKSLFRRFMDYKGVFEKPKPNQKPSKELQLNFLLSAIGSSVAIGFVFFFLPFFDIISRHSNIGWAIMAVGFF